jgi:hypothetical protein
MQKYVDAVNARQTGAARMTFKPFDQYSALPVDMAKAYNAQERLTSADLSGGICLGLSFAFLKYRKLKDEHGSGDADVAQAVKATLQQSFWRPDKSKPSFVAGVTTHYENYPLMIAAMHYQHEALKTTHAKGLPDLYKRLGEMFLPNAKHDPAPLDSHLNWTSDAKLATRSGYHLVDCPKHAMAVTISHQRQAFKFYDPNAGFATATTYDTMAEFLRAYLDEKYYKDWTLYSFF